MITEYFAKKFTTDWINSWNSHDLESILSHYTDDFTIETPMATTLLPESNGVVQGKDAVRSYWAIGLAKIPDLEFEVMDVLLGINSLTIFYVNKATGRKSAEMMCFNKDKKVNRAFVHYN